MPAVLALGLGVAARAEVEVRRLPMLPIDYAICCVGGRNCRDVDFDTDDEVGSCRHYLNHAATNEPVCVLDLAQDGPMNLHEVAAALGMSFQRVAQIEAVALEKLTYHAKWRRLRDLRLFLEGDGLPESRMRLRVA